MAHPSYRVDRRIVAGDWPFWLLITLDAAVTLFLFPRLPQQIPAHWGLSGQVTRMAGPWEVALFWPLFALAIYLLLLYLPLVDPKKENYPRFNRPLRLMRQAIPALLLGLHLAQLAGAVGVPVTPPSVLVLSLSLLFLTLGSYMGELQPNHLIGIRTPWTLANKEVWQRTHQGASRLWVPLSLLHLATLLLPAKAGFAASMIILLLMVLVPVVHSYLLFQRLEG